MNFGKAVKSGFKNYANFQGRATRSEFWYWTLFFAMAYTGFYLAYITIGQNMGVSLMTAEIGNALMIAMLLLPSVAVTTRRLHDTNRSGWWQLIGVALFIGVILLPGLVNRQLGGILPMVALFALLGFLAKESDPAPNRFGLQTFEISSLNGVD